MSKALRPQAVRPARPHPARIAFWKRLSVRLGVLLLLMVLVLEGSSLILLNSLLRDVEGEQQLISPLLASSTWRHALINIIVIVMLTLLGATFFARNLLVEPIARLTEATEALAEGNFGITLPVDSGSELGVLAQAFNQMSTRLASKNARLLAANAALRTSEERYALALQGANDGIWDWNPQDDVMYFSPRWKAMLGYQDDELANTLETWWTLAHPKDRKRVQDALAQHAESDARYFNIEYRMRCSDGAYMWVQARATTARDAHNSIVRMAGSQTDISERVHALQLLEQRVQERTEQLSVLLDLATTTAVTVELEPLLDTILRKLKTVVDFTAASVFALEPALAAHIQTAEGELSLLHYQGPAALESLEARWQLSHVHTLANALQQRQPHVIHTSEEAQALSPTFQQLIHSYLGESPVPTASWLGLPLIVRDKVVGLLALEHIEAHYYHQARQELAMAFAAQVAVALENIRLYDEAQASAALEERRHLARELHDSVSQALFSIAMGAQTASKQLARTLHDNASHDDLQQHASQRLAAVAEPLAFVETMAQAGLAEMRALIFELRPESLAQEGLVVAIQKQAQAIQARHQLRIDLQVSLEPPLPFEHKQALYRIVQEALHNVVKHARAQHIRIRLHVEEGLELVIELAIEDDGIGFAVPEGFSEGGPTFPGHLGLVSMRERAQAMGAHLLLRSAPGQGTALAVQVRRAKARVSSDALPE